VRRIRHHAHRGVRAHVFLKAVRGRVVQPEDGVVQVDVLPEAVLLEDAGVAHHGAAAPPSAARHVGPNHVLHRQRRHQRLRHRPQCLLLAGGRHRPEPLVRVEARRDSLRDGEGLVEVEVGEALEERGGLQLVRLAQHAMHHARHLRLGEVDAVALQQHGELPDLLPDGLQLRLPRAAVLLQPLLRLAHLREDGLLPVVHLVRQLPLLVRLDLRPHVVALVRRGLVRAAGLLRAAPLRVQRLLRSPQRGVGLGQAKHLRVDLHALLLQRLPELAVGGVEVPGAQALLQEQHHAHDSPHRHDDLRRWAWARCAGK